MREDVYNVFLMLTDQLCTALRYKVHSVDAPTGKALKFMKNRVERDLKDSAVFELQEPFTKTECYSYCRAGRNMELFEPLFQKVGAGKHPLLVVTMVRNGKIIIDGSMPLNDTNVYLRPEFMDGQQMDDWLSKYRNGRELESVPELMTLARCGG